MCFTVMFAPANKTLVGGERTSFRGTRTLRLVLGLLCHVLFHPHNVHKVLACVLSTSPVFSDPKPLSQILNSDLQGLTEYAQTPFVNINP